VFQPAAMTRSAIILGFSGLSESASTSAARSSPLTRFGRSDWTGADGLAALDCLATLGAFIPESEDADDRFVVFVRPPPASPFFIDVAFALAFFVTFFVAMRNSPHVEVFA